MKRYTSLFTALNVAIAFFHIYGMETDQFLKNFSTLRKEMNEFTKGNPKSNELFITRTIEEMRDAGILDQKYYYYDYVYNKETKPYIFQQFFTHYPQQICPELQSIVDSINDEYDRQDFLNILSTINTNNEKIKQYINQIVRIIKNQEGSSTYKNKTFRLEDETMNVIHKALNAICSSLNEEYATQKEHVTANQDKTKEIALLTKIKTQQSLLGYLLPIEESINNPHHFAFFFNKINEKIDPKDETAMKLLKLYKQRLETEAINSTNAIVSKYPLISDQLQLIEERLHKHSVSLLKKTVTHNQRILDKHPELLAYSQQIITPKQDLSEEELPKLLLEPEPTETNIPSQKLFKYTIKSTSKWYPASMQRGTSDTEKPIAKPQQPKEPKQQPNIISRTINFIWSGISSVFNWVISWFK